jgi:Protein of unknown function (DUF1638)
MRRKAIVCEVLRREMEAVIARSSHAIDLEPLPMGLHELGGDMRPRLQQSIDNADGDGYDSILLGYGLCGRGTDGLKAGKTQLVLPRFHDCIGMLMGSRDRYLEYFEGHTGVYYRSPGWVEFQTPGQVLEPAMPSTRKKLGERNTLEQFIATYGEDDGKYLFEQFSAFRRHYSGLTYISTPVPSDARCRESARDEAEKEQWDFEEVQGTLDVFARLINGPWDESDFLVVPPGATIRGNTRSSIVECA